MRFSESIKLFSKYRSLEKSERTNRGYELDLKQFCLYMRNPLITQVTPEHILEYLTSMKELGWDKNTIMIKAVQLSQFFKFWKRKGYPVLNPELIPHVKREWKMPKIANVEHFKKLIQLCDKYPKDPYFIRNKAMLLLTADTGARNGEICSMLLVIDTEKYEKFSEENQYKHVIKTEKTRGRNPFRPIFWYEETNQALKKWISVRKKIKNIVDKDALFIGVHHGQGTRNHGQRMSVSNFAVVLRKMSRMAEIPFLNAHSLRHLKGNDLAAGGTNNTAISNILGHASLSSSKIYTDLNDPQMASVHLKHKRKLM